ncbi:MAG TPA: hypothetical protein V6C81_00895 [Planktothrix sp.]|jgi:hypothetical protein
MRVLFPLIFVFILFLVFSSWKHTVVEADPRAEGVAFLKDVRDGGLAKSVKHFGGNTCRCPAKGGWGSYLIYVSGQEPNLAFMTGHRFTFGDPVMTRMKNDRKALSPWQKPEDFAIDIPIAFDNKVYAPLFLPLNMAYGDKMTQAQLDEFLKDPDKDAWKGFTLRMRPSLKPGAIAPPNEPLPKTAAEEFKDLEKKPAEEKDEASTEDAVREALGAKALKYLKPKDAGAVVDADGKPVPTDKVEAELPHLKSATLRLHVVRRGALNDWTIYHFGLMYPVLEFNDGREVHLEHDRRPSSLPRDPTQGEPVSP